MKKKYTYEDLLDIIKKLRSKNGCPWDREQTHGSLKRCLIEEAYEVYDAIDGFEKNGDDTNLMEELGDLLLQVVMHSEIAEEEGRFQMEDVVQGISEKMIRRHPHVFGNEIAEDSERVLLHWEDIKNKEREETNTKKTELECIPSVFPALIWAQKVNNKSDKLYTDQNVEAESLMEIVNITSDFKNIKNQNHDHKTKEEKIGKVLYEVVNLARIHNIDAEEALKQVVKNVIHKRKG